MNEWLTMGGYAAYVWSCFGLALAVLGWNAVAASRLHAAARRAAEKRRDTGGDA